MSWTDDRADGWISDFFDTAAFRELPPAAKEWAPEVLPAFFRRACADAAGPGELSEADCRAGLLEGVRALALPESARAVAPDLCGAFLGELEAQGRLADGRALGRFVRALRGAYGESTAETVKPIRNPGARIGRNAPCPCGSGKKYKNCCMR